MLTIIFCWFILFIIIALVGRLCMGKKLLVFLGVKENLEWYEYFWIGLIAVIGILQIWSIFFPVNVYSFVFVSALAAVSLVLLIRKGFKLPGLTSVRNILIENINLIAISAVVLSSISYSASLPVGWEDTLLYHLNAVKWNYLYPAVPGLTNLHLRLGLSSSLFLFASMIESFAKDRSSHIALSSLASVLSLEFIWIFLKTKTRTLKLFCLFVLPLFVSSILRRTLVASLSPDFALVIIALAVSYEFLKGDRKSFLVAGVLSILLLTIKLSGFSFGIIILVFAFYKLIRTDRKKLLRIFLLFASVGVFILIPYLVRDVILSGWLFYPLPMFRINVPWAVPESIVKLMSAIIKAWAISPGVGWREQVGLSFWQWFPGWYTRNNWAIEMKMFFFGISLILIAPLIKIVNKDLISRASNFIFLGVASLAGIFFMLFTAPDFRFGEVYFWIFFAAAASYYVNIILEKNPGFKIFFVILFGYFIFTITWPVRIDSKPIGKSVRWEPSFPVADYTITPEDGSPEFKILIPTDSELCGNSELPCAPGAEYLKIKERVPGNISKGFAPVN
jgi:hypothetical protein